MPDGNKPVSKHAILMACSLIFAELHLLRYELTTVTQSSTILLRVLNGVSYTISSDVENKVLKAATQAAYMKLNDPTLTVDQCLEDVKACRRISVEVLTSDKGWDVELERTLHKQWKQVVCMLFIISQSLPMQEPLQPLFMLDMQADEPKRQPTIATTSRDKPKPNNLSKAKSKARNVSSGAKSKTRDSSSDVKTKLLYLRLPARSSEGDVVTVQTHRNSTGEEYVTSNARVDVLEKPKGVRIEQPQSSLMKLLRSSSRLFRLPVSRGEFSEDPPGYEKIVEEKTGWVDHNGEQ